MIDGWKEQTHDLTEKEKYMLPSMVYILVFAVGRDNAIKADGIRDRMQKEGYSVSPPRIRKLINYIRVKGMVELLVASSKGYYVATDLGDTDRFITSLQQRIDAIEGVKNAIVEQRNKKYAKN